MRHPRLWRAYANLATLANGLCGAGAIAYVVLGNKLFALALVFIGIGWDGLDGFFSRRSGLPPNLFGRVADSVADAVTFALAPAAIIFFDNYPRSAWAAYDGASLAVAVLVGGLAIARLVYFTVRAHALPHFLGASTPQNALALALLVLLLQNPAYLTLSPPLFLVLAALLAIVMVLPIPYPKMRGHASLRALVVAMTVTDVFALAIPNFRPDAGTVPYLAAEAMAIVAMALLVTFYGIGPWVARNDALQKDPSAPRTGANP